MYLQTGVVYMFTFHGDKSVNIACLIWVNASVCAEISRAGGQIRGRAGAGAITGPIG